MPLLGSIDLVGYTEIKIGKCAECKERFTYTKHHRYVRNDGRTKLYCSWHCYRVKAAEYEAKAREAFEKECRKEEKIRLRAEAYRKARREAGRSVDDTPVLVDLEEAQKYLEHVKERIVNYSKELLNAEPATSERERARKNLNRWERKYKNVQDRIQELKRSEQNVQEPGVYEGHEQG